MDGEYEVPDNCDAPESQEMHAGSRYLASATADANTHVGKELHREQCITYISGVVFPRCGNLVPYSGS